MKALEKPFLFTYSVMQKEENGSMVVHLLGEPPALYHQFHHCFSPFFLQIPCGYFDMQDLITPNACRKLTPLGASPLETCTYLTPRALHLHDE